MIIRIALAACLVDIARSNSCYGYRVMTVKLFTSRVTTWKSWPKPHTKMKARPVMSYPRGAKNLGNQWARVRFVTWAVKVHESDLH